MDKKKLLIVLSSHNKNKLLELNTTLAKAQVVNKALANIEFVLASDFNLSAPNEDGISFEENALIKAKFVSEATGLIALSDDSGIEISAINNQPGIDSSIWVEKYGSDLFNYIYELMASSKDRSASFVTTICLYFPNEFVKKLQLKEKHVFFSGVLAGEIASKPKGSGGFAYDKIFIPKYYQNKILMGKTFAEVSFEDKNAISHRQMALMKAMEYISTWNML